MTISEKIGQRVPDVTFKIRDDYRWITKTSDDYFKGKRVVLFALPGAFTPTCSSVHLPRYNELAQSLKENGIDDVICLSVNDSFVLNEWKRMEHADNITMIPDGNGEFSRKIGLIVNKEDLCFGERSWRYSMVVNNGVIEKMFLEPEEEGDPYGASSAENMLHYLNPQAEIPPSIVIFTRRGCIYCAQAKEILRQQNQDFEELILSEDFTIKTVKAISNTTKLPQIFINGKRVGGAEELDDYFRSKPSKALGSQPQNQAARPYPLS
jgi:glutathione-dependent peroxiredoxin